MAVNVPHCKRRGGPCQLFASQQFGGTRSLAADPSAGLVGYCRLDLLRRAAACLPSFFGRNSCRRVCSCGGGWFGLCFPVGHRRVGPLCRFPQNARLSRCRPCGIPERRLVSRRSGRHGPWLLTRPLVGSGNTQHCKQRSRYHCDKLHDYLLLEQPDGHTLASGRRAAAALLTFRKA